ncbi:TauD/TfdA family dioxygenase [Streptomyces sp. NPDC056831]|uniref:TauD/TfdA family dioxygenase n=1 Tax=Streptomyces sp. NPDC056831 TaxID=3345954 RepID=UPI003687A09F
MTSLDAMVALRPTPGAAVAQWEAAAVGEGLKRALRERANEGWLLVPEFLGSVLPADTPTPPDWRHAGESTQNAGSSADMDQILRLIACSLGPILTWPNQQGGALVHDIVPTRGAESMQIGASSSTELLLHTEDAFHRDRAQVVLLACVRNPDRIPTHVSSVRKVTLPQAHWERLAERQVVIAPDTSYGAMPSARDTQTPAVATVWTRGGGHRCLRYDPAYSQLPEDDSFNAAYRALEEELAAERADVVLAPGDLLVIDNDVAVHGRARFQARYDGTDRWLKRALVSTTAARPAEERHEPDHGQLPTFASGTGAGAWTY